MQQFLFQFQLNHQWTPKKSKQMIWKTKIYPFEGKQLKIKPEMRTLPRIPDRWTFPPWHAAWCGPSGWPSEQISFHTQDTRDCSTRVSPCATSDSPPCRKIQNISNNGIISRLRACSDGVDIFPISQIPLHMFRKCKTPNVHNKAKTINETWLLYHRVHAH